MASKPKIKRQVVAFKKRRPYIEVSNGNYIPRGEMVDYICDFLNKMTSDTREYSYRLTFCERKP